LKETGSVAILNYPVMNFLFIRHVNKKVKYLNLSAMKRILVLLVVSTLMSNVFAQKSIDALFDKYADHEGFTTFSISGNLLKFIKCDEDRKDEDHLPLKITEIRILAQEDDAMKVENFYDLVIKDINLREYEEFMRVKEYHQDLRMLVKSDGNIIKEFLLIGGGEDNLVIQIKGEITIQEAEEFSSEVKREHGKDILSNLN